MPYVYTVSHRTMESKSSLLRRRFQTSAPQRGPIPTLFGFTDTSNIARRTGSKRGYAQSFSSTIDTTSNRPIRQRRALVHELGALAGRPISNMPRSSFTRRGPAASWRARGGPKSPGRFRRRGARPFRPKFKRFRGRIRRRYGRKFGGSFAKRVENVLIKKVGQDNTFLRTYVDHPTVAQTNNQGAVQLMHMTNSITSGAFAASSTTNLAMWDPFMVNSVFAGNDSAAKPTRRFIFKKYQASAQITNTHTGAVEVYEFRCKTRRLQPSYAAFNDLIADGHQDASQDEAADTVISATQYGATPYDLPRFVKEIKILKVRKFILQPGQRQDIRYIARGPRIIEKNTLYAGSTSSAIGTLIGAPKGMTFSVFVCRPTWSGLPGNTAGYRLGVGGSTIGIVYTVRIHYTWINHNFRTTVISQNIPGISGGNNPAPVAATSVILSAGTGTGPTDQDEDG